MLVMFYGVYLFIPRHELNDEQDELKTCRLLNGKEDGPKFTFFLLLKLICGTFLWNFDDFGYSKFLAVITIMSQIILVC